jgi:tRNA(Ile)-lysidine synthase
MLEQFDDNNSQKGLFSSKHKLLVAISGGVDSMVLTNLLLNAGYEVALAHCNYQLRGKESDYDQKLIEEFAQNNGLKLYAKLVDTASIVEESNVSIQMVAREERYKFFEELMNDHGYDLTLLAHNADDRIESLLINVLRGTGIRGLQGMPVKRERYVRPLMFACKSDVRNYAVKNQIDFREDASNSEVYYQRNWVRLRVLPLLREIDCNIDTKLLGLAQRVEAELPSYHDFISEKKLSINGNSENSLSVSKLQDSKSLFTLLREILAPHGFSSDQVFEVIDLLESNSGSIVETDQARVLKDREELLIQPKSESVKMPLLRFEEVNRNELSSFGVEQNQTLIDSELVNKDEFKLRHWKNGDRFKPLGMNGWKKLSDFFIDQKLSIIEKEKVWLLTQNDTIVWIIGMRLDQRFRVSESTQKVLKVTACF